MIIVPPSLERDLARLQNVFKKLALPCHPLRDQAITLRDEISMNWGQLAEQNEWFAWPSTAVSQGPNNGKLDGSDWRPQGMLSLLGYHVGETLSLHPAVRESVLEYAFECHLPPVNDIAYFEEWGEPRSARRLMKLANTLAWAMMAGNERYREPGALAA
jgi:hypothetical protein